MLPCNYLLILLFLQNFQFILNFLIILFSPFILITHFKLKKILSLLQDYQLFLNTPIILILFIIVFQNIKLFKVSLLPSLLLINQYSYHIFLSFFQVPKLPHQSSNFFRFLYPIINHLNLLFFHFSQQLIDLLN